MKSLALISNILMTNKTKKQLFKTAKNMLLFISITKMLKIIETKK